MKITVLIENTTHSKLQCEHGLSLLIEYNKKKYLLDAGQSDKFMANARDMSVDLSDVTYGILSHGHYDHSGGFASYLRVNKSIKVYAMETTPGKFYSASGGMHEIGVPDNVLPEFKDRFIWIKDSITIDDGVYLVPHSTNGLEQIGNRTGLYRECNGKMLPDDFGHELSLVFDTKNGLAIFNSCSHGGLCNIIKEVTNVLPDRKIIAFVGGLHMKGMKDGVEYCTFSHEEIANIAEFLREHHVGKIYTGHCTGEEGYKLISEAYGKQYVEKLFTGKIIQLK